MSDTIKHAACFKCGSGKDTVLGVCQQCGGQPRNNHEKALSLVLSPHVSTSLQIAIFAYEISHRLRLTLSGSLLAQGWAALNDVELMATLRMAPEPPIRDPSHSCDKATTEFAPQPAPTPGVKGPTTPPPRRAISLHSNPFHLLGATTHDDLRTILDLAQRKSLEADIALSEKARADLTHPRIRLDAEISWLPGVSPTAATALIEQLSLDEPPTYSDIVLPPLAHANLLADALSPIAKTNAIKEIASFILGFASVVERIDAVEVLRDINADRDVSGFPVVATTGHIEAVLAQRMRSFRNAIRRPLTPQCMIDVMTLIVRDATDNGRKLAPSFIDDLVDDYEIDSHSALQRDANHIYSLTNAALDAAPKGSIKIDDYLDQLEVIARNWHRAAQPIQLSVKARGTSHSLSAEVAEAIRGLGIDIHNKHGMTRQALRLTTILQELFSELPEIKEQLDADAALLARLSQTGQATA